MSEQYLVCRTAFYNCYYEKIGKEVRNITNELPFEIPNNWTWVRLLNYCYLNGGYAFKSTNFSNEGIRVIRISDFDEGGIKSKEIKRYPYSNEMDKSKIEVDDIIVCMTGGTVGKSLYIKQLDEPSYLNQRVALIRAKEKLSDYLSHVFKSPYIQELVKGNITSTNDNISMNFLNNILIPIPPFKEQLRIQSKLSRCEPLIKKYEQSERKLTQLELELEEKLKASILQYAIEGKLVKQDSNDEPASKLLERIKAEKERLIKEGKIKRDKSDSEITFGDDKNYYQNHICIPQNWELTNLSNISIIQEGAGIRTYQYKNEGIHLLTVTNILEGSIDVNISKKYVSYEEFLSKYKHLKLNKGDIVTACSGGSWGKSAIFNIDEEFMLNTSTLRLRFYGDIGDNYYLYMLTKSIFFKKQLQKQLSGMQPNFGYSHYKKILVPLPPLKEQQRIVAKLKQIFFQFY